MANEKEKIEVTTAVAEVEKTEAKVEQIKADRAAKKAKKQNDRLENWKWKGGAKIVNYCENNWKPIGIGILIGGPAGVAAVEGGKKIYNHFKSKKTDEVTVEEEEPVSNEASEAPFDA